MKISRTLRVVGRGNRICVCACLMHLIRPAAVPSSVAYLHERQSRQTLHILLIALPRWQNGQDSKLRLICPVCHASFMACCIFHTRLCSQLGRNQLVLSEVTRAECR